MSDAQYFEDQFARHLRSYAAAGAPSLEREAIKRAVAAGVASRQVAPWRLRLPALRPPMLAQAAVVGMVVVLAAVVVFGIWGGGRNNVAPGGTAIPTSSPSAQPRASGDGTLMKWSKLNAQALGLVVHPRASAAVTRVAWVDDHFVLVEQSQQLILASNDGLSWDTPEEDSRDLDYYEPMAQDSIASWQDDVIGWTSAGNTLRIARPANAPNTYEFEGRIGAAATGRAGMLVRTHSTLNFDDYITSLMGSGWVKHMTSFSFTDGILRITADDRPELNIVWADQGFEPGDVADRGFGWFSLDGEDWTSIPDFPDNVSAIAAIENGFIASGSALWYSADGLAWRRIGTYSNTSLIQWMGGVVTAVGDSNRPPFALWTSEGPRDLPVAGELDLGSTIGAGPLGMVSLESDGMILYSPDGSDWSVAPVPEEMAADATSRWAPTIAVGEGSVVVLVWREEADESRTPSLWLGTIEP